MLNKQHLLKLGENNKRLYNKINNYISNTSFLIPFRTYAWAND